MTLEEFYAAVGGNYSGVLSRIRNEAMIKKFVIKYTADKTCDMLKTAFEEKDWQTAFRAAHTLKDVAQNLSFDALYEVSAVLTEELRGEKAPDNREMFDKVIAEHEKLVELAKNIDW